MWGSSEEPPGTMEAGPPKSVANLKETCEQSKNQLETVKDIMLRNKQSLKKKEEELQEYAKKLSKFKTRKPSRPLKDSATSSSDSTPKSKSDISITEPTDDNVDEISQAKTPKAKSSLLQKKLAEDRKIFEQRSKELTESKRAAEEKVEALRQQLEDTYLAPVVPVNPVVITSQPAHHYLELGEIQDRDNKITELNSKILELEATIIDLQDNLKEKDSVIDSKTKAVTLMSADLSKKGKTTLDTLEDTKDEMRSMQQNFVLVEESLKNKNDNLLKQLEEKNDQVSKLEETVESLTEKLEAQKQADTVSADFSRSTMDTLAETKDAMKSMQENFVLIESSLKSKNEHLLKQLEEREIKLAEAEARILNLESGVGIERHPDLEDLLYKIEKLEKTNHDFQDEKYELQKSIAELQDQIIAGQQKLDDDLVAQKDNKIAELEALVQELKATDESLKEKLERDLEALNEKNKEMSNQVSSLETQVQTLESEKAELVQQASAAREEPAAATKDDERLAKLTKELEESNKSMIKLKAQHQKKLKNLQKQLENFKKVSDTNAELVKLGNQVALLEEEKGNLQLSLVDFDELKASAAESKERASELEGKVAAQAKEIEAHIEAIAILENQKLDLMQELHAVKQEVSDLEAENAESDNLRVSAEMKLVELEEQLESSHRLAAEQQQRAEELQLALDGLQSRPVDTSESSELLTKIDELTRENQGLLERLSRLEDKAASSSEDSGGSSESFERIAPERAPEEQQQQREEQQQEQQQQQPIEHVEREKIEELEREIERCQQLVAEQQREIDELKSQLLAKEEQLERLTARLDEEGSAGQLETLRSELEASASLASDWQLKAEQLNEAKLGIEEGLRALESENRALSEQSAAKDAIKEQLDATIAELERRSREQNETIAGQEGLVAELRAAVRAADDELRAKDARLHTETAEADELRERLARLEVQLQQRDERIAGLDEELAAVGANAGATDEQLSEARRQLSELQSRLERSASSEEHQEALERLSEREMQVAELEARQAQLIGQVNELRERLDSLQNENARLSERLVDEERQAMELLESNGAQAEQLRGAELAKAELENRLLELQAVHEETLRHAGQLDQELSDAYRMLEQLKIKHTEDTAMSNQRLEDVLEELQARGQELASLQAELEEAHRQPAELTHKLVEAEEKAQAQLEKMKKYAAVAKKKTAQCEELEGKIRELEDSLTLEKSDKEARNQQLQDSLASVHQKDNRIVELEEQLQVASVERDQAYEKMSALEQQLQELADAKDNARELGVRMQVMEAEYVEQLAEINSLKTGNALLLSKQAQISERLENAEKESEERRQLLDQLEKEHQLEENRRSESASRLQELEAKLHERDAEIENLDNELHNSIDNLVQMQENLRQSGANAGLQQSYDELLAQFNGLRASSEETQAKHETLLAENAELAERITRLQELNASMQERIEAAEAELSRDAQAAASLDELNARYAQLLHQLDSQQAELEATRLRLHEAVAANESTEHQLRARVSLLEQEKHNLLRQLEKPTEAVVVSEADAAWGFDEASDEFLEKEPVEPAAPEDASQPALFDASVFGASPPGAESLDQLLLGNSARTVDTREPPVDPNELQQLRETIALLEAALTDNRSEQARLSDELERTREALRERDTRLEAIERQAEQLNHEKRQLEQAIDATLTQINGGIDNSNNERTSQLVGAVEQLLQELHHLKANNEQLSAAEEVCKKRALELDNQLRAASESTRIAELEERVARTLGERDLLQLQLNDATRSFDDYKIELQQQLDALAGERNQLQAQLVATTTKPEVEEAVSVAISAPAPTEAVPTGSGDLASMWDDDEEDPWGFNDKPSKDDHPVHIPVVPSAELELKLKLEELEEKLAELTEENTKLQDQAKVAQLKNVKYVKKLKEYKVQLDSVQRQLQSQSSMGGFGADLDSAIEEELKSQMAQLEKALAEAKEEARKALAEKEGLLKRVDVLTAATERFTEAKEKQDTEVHIWQMRYKELQLKLNQLEATPAATADQESSSASVPAASSDAEAASSDANQQQIKELRESVEALAAENEELQQLLEEQRSKGQQSSQDQTKAAAQIEELRVASDELTAINAKLKSDYELLRRQYEQSLMDADEQVQSTRQSCEIVKSELSARCEQLEEQLNVALEDKAQLESKLDGLQLDLQQAIDSRDHVLASQATLEDRLKGLELSIEGYTVQVQEKDELVRSLQDQLEQADVQLQVVQQQQQQSDASDPHLATDDVPVFTFSSDNDNTEIEALRAKLQEKEAEIEHLAYSLNEGSLTRVVQELQDNINGLYNDKAELEKSLIEKDHLIEQLKESKPEREDERGVAKLEQELQERERELEQLRVQLAQSGSSQDDELRGELREKQQQLESLALNVSELQSELANLRGLEGLAAEDRATVERLHSEKEEIRTQAEESIARLLQQKEQEISLIKEELASERQSLLEALGLRDQELERVRAEWEQQTQQLITLEAELSERDRRLAELSISKDTDIHRLSVTLSETNARLEELAALSEEEHRQLTELRQQLQVKEQQISGLQHQLHEKTKEYELIQHALQRHVGQTGDEHSAEAQQQLGESGSESLDSSSANELDVALYMLHQRDVRCEELTLELMQLLEERDTLQLRLSNAIRVNEDLKKHTSGSAASSPSKDSSTVGAPAPTVEDPSPSQSEGPVEIAREAIHSPIGEDKKALAQKLSQLKSVHQTKDVGIRNERELRNTQQMSLLARKDALHTLPPEAAARLVNANYTVSRDVQSQSSILMNWLWGKSTPKVVHM